MGTASTEPESRQPVMADVARVAGVSHQTVSRVLNGAPHVRPDTRDRVLAAIRELDYRPNSAARALVTRRSQTLGVVSFGSALYGPASMLDGIEQAARSAGYFVSVASLRSLDSRSVQEAVDRLRDQGVEGIVVIAPQISAVSAVAKLSSAVPVVAVGSGSQSRVPMVAVDNESGALAATRHLLDLGHATVHHVAGPPAGWRPRPDRTAGARPSRPAAPRCHRYRAATGARGPGTRPDYGSPRILWSRRSSAPTTTWPSACSARSMRRDGRFPGDISVVGFDDIPEAAYFAPPLTTVRQDFGELGRRALELLVEELTGVGHARSHVLISPEMVLRRSAGPVAR